MAPPPGPGYMQTALPHEGSSKWSKEPTVCAPDTTAPRPTLYLTWCDLYPISQRTGLRPGKVTPTSHTLTNGDRG